MIKLNNPRIHFSFEARLIAFLVFIVITVCSTGIMAYKAMERYNEAIIESHNPEVRTILIKSISGYMASAEGSIKSYNLSKDKEYLAEYNRSKINLKSRLDMLEKMIEGNVKQQMRLDSVRFLVVRKLDYLDGFIELQYRNLITNELNSIADKIERNKREVVILNTREPEKKPGFMDRVFRKKKVKKEKANKEQKALERQIKLLEEVKNEVAKVKQKQGNKLTSIDKKELGITQKNKAISEQINNNITYMQVEELLEARENLLELKKLGGQTNEMITVFSIAASLLLLVIGFVVISFLRKRRAYEKALEVAKNEAEHYSQMQETFLANMSHEIRTPMNAIAGFTEQVLQSGLKPQQQSFMQIVQRSIQHLLVIINDILDYSKLKADKLTIEHIPFDLEQVIDESVLLMSEIAAQKQIEIRNRVGHGIQKFVMGDPVRMKQVMLNLLGNAIKFTDTGSVTVTLDVLEESPMHSVVELRVIDTGIGISPENISRIFDAFEQAEVSTTRKYGGSGLGLSITHKLVTLMNGSISLESTEGSGTTAILKFTFELAADAQQMANEPETSLHKILEGKEILIADDEEWNTALLATILAKYNTHFTIVKNGKEAVDFVTNHHVDLVLTDVRMPVLNGFEATMVIRQLPEPKNKVPVIALTAATGQQQLQQCYEAGMNAVLGKPYSEQQFFKVVARAMSHMVIPLETAEVKEQEVNTADNKASFSLVQLEQMSNGDKAFFDKMLRIFIDTTKDTLDKIKEAIANKDFPTIDDYAHKLAPPSRHLEAKALLKVLKELEAKAKRKELSGMKELYEAALKEYKIIAAEMKKLLDK